MLQSYPLLHQNRVQRLSLVCTIVTPSDVGIHFAYHHYDPPLLPTPYWSITLPLSTDSPKSLELKLRAIDYDTESCSSRVIAATESSPAVMSMSPRAAKHQMLKVDVFNNVLRRFEDGDFAEASVVGFEDQLQQHFNRLLARYERASLSLRLI
ncbi:Serine/threonine-protein kinase STY46-like protein [Drosera capensis]